MLTSRILNIKYKIKETVYYENTDIHLLNRPMLFHLKLGITKNYRFLKLGGAHVKGVGEIENLLFFIF